MVISEVDHYSEASGSMINRDKCESLWLGGGNPDFGLPDTLPGPQESAKVLGISFGHGDYSTKNWDGRLKDAAQKVDQWKGWSLTLRERVHLIKSYLIPLFIYLGSVCILPEACWMRIYYSLFFQLLWGNRLNLVRREVTYRTRRLGGLSMVNPVVFLVNTVLKANISHLWKEGAPPWVFSCKEWFWPFFQEWETGTSEGPSYTPRVSPGLRCPNSEGSAMALLLPILLAVLVSVIGGLYMLGMFRKRRTNEPPLDKGTIPWLGYALDFRKSTSEFLKKMQKKHGDIFTVQIGGYYFTFVTDPLSFGPIVKEARSKLDFEQFAMELVARVFGYHPMVNDHKLLEKASTKHLMGDGLVLMTQAMMENLQNLMLHSIGSGDGEKKWQQDGLFNYSYNIVFRAGYLALFGNEPAKSQGSLDNAKKFDRDHSDELFIEFRKYDKLFPRLAYAVLPPKDKLEAERLKRLFWNILSIKRTLQKENISGWIMDQHQVRVENGMPEHMQDRFMFLLLWASQGNTGPACFWLLLYLMKHPEAMKAVHKEIEEVLKETNQEVKPGGALINLTRDMLLKTPVLDSAVEETLRLTAAPVLIRAVKENMNLKMSSGKEYAIRKGDRIALFPYTAVQMDPEVHPEPEKFKYNRFLNVDGTKKTEFFKNGKRLKFFTMPWGAGTTICPGRFFAINELKQFIFLMLSYFEFELVNPKEEIPGIDPNRWGFGTMQPTHDIQFRYRLRY